MKKQGILNRELSAVFATLGHGDTVVIADCGLPIPTTVKCVDLSYTIGEPNFQSIFNSVKEDMVFEKVTLANEIKDNNPQLERYIEKEIGKVEVAYLSHQKFKEDISKAKVVIRTGEATPYANVILQSGVIF
ncbi:D-ribose pyranase [Paraliobacillus salinarum]|uniref:D-ribose pyranase n=1 Tax=Paraliobacillus salinarum TaxID=1158996 RepID=UPI0015F7440B|nr:D-ribose pyranase [Paraliobacillus salinarum]